MQATLSLHYKVICHCYDTAKTARLPFHVIFKTIKIYSVKVLLFVGTNFRGFYKMQWSMGSWIRGFKHYMPESMGKMRSDVFLPSYSTVKNLGANSYHTSRVITFDIVKRLLYYIIIWQWFDCIICLFMLTWSTWTILYTIQSQS
jgi:hypothetical protein